MQDWTNSLSSQIRSRRNAGPPEWDLLLMAAQKNNVNQVLRLLYAEGVPPSHSNVVGQTALHIAAMWGSVEVLEELIAAGANVNIQNQIAGTPLNCAIKGTSISLKETHPRRVRCVEILLEAGADVELCEANGKSVLECIDDAIREARMRDGGNIEEQMKEMKEVLRRWGLDASPLARCIEEADAKGVRECLGGNKDQALNLNEGLCNAVEKFNVAAEERSSDSVVCNSLKEIIHDLLEAGADPNCASSDSVPLLHVVCLSVCPSWVDSAAADVAPDIARDLLSRGAAVGPKTMALLLTAAFRGDVRSVEFLTRFVGVDANFRGRQGMTALIHASRSGKLDVVKLLLENDSVDLSVADDRGKIAMDYATANRKEEIMNLLAERQEALKKWGLELAQCIEEMNVKGASECLGWGKAQGLMVNEGLHIAIEKFRVAVDERSSDGDLYLSLKEIINCLLKAGADPNSTSSDSDEPPLYVICSSVCSSWIESAAGKVTPDTAMDIAMDLLAHGSVVGPKTMALLPTAALMGDVRSVEFLTRFVGVNPNFRSRQGMTALMHASRSGKTNVVKLLLEHESLDLNIVDDRGKKAVDYANANRKEEIVKLLAQKSYKGWATSWRGLSMGLT